MHDHHSKYIQCRQWSDHRSTGSDLNNEWIYNIPCLKGGDDRGNVEVAGQSGASKAIKVLVIREKDTLSGGWEGKARRNLN